MDANEKNLQTAMRFDVATFETSELLSKFINGTNLYWCKRTDNELGVYSLLEVRLLCEKHGESYLTVLCEAPQAREIAKVLPEKIEASAGNGETAFAYLTISVHGEVAYYLNYTDRYVSWEEIADYYGEDADSEAAMSFDNFHIAQGLADMYLKLCDIGLLNEKGGEQWI
jgi:hypothetical protein